ncbi:MAG: hypothetical protein PHC75_09070 [Burkholderiales bacterium]|nr:hypothetical protein [Burkholderiales bacterium]
MKNIKMKKVSAALVMLGSTFLVSCNSGVSSGQNVTGAPVAANSVKSLFTTNSCLTGKVNFASDNAWYTSGSIDIVNTCDTDETLTGQTISFSSQDKAGNEVQVGTLNNWWINGAAYKLEFASAGSNKQVGTVSAENGSPVIKANQTISFNGGLNLNNSTYDSTTAQNTFTINGSTPTPPTPDKTATLNVVVDTKDAGCSSKFTCTGMNVNVTNSSGTSVANFIVEPTSFGATYTKPVTGLTDNQNYTVEASVVSGATITYTPKATNKVSSSSASTVTIKYVMPITKTGSAKISIPTVIDGYTDNLQIQLVNSISGTVVNTYSVKQGDSFTTEALPISDSTHKYQVKMTTGIADPLNGLYYIESGLPVVKINSGKTTELSVPMKQSKVAVKTVKVAISGLQASDKANVEFSDAANKYSYVKSNSKSNSTTSYKIEKGLNLGIAVQANGTTSYETNPITNTHVISANATINANFVKSITPPTPSADKIVTAYLLIDSPAQLQKYVDDLNKVSKVNFNRVVFSFVKPTMTKYVSGNLANTGIMGYFENGDGKGEAAFTQLKNAVTLSKAKNIQAFLSVGGWNYSCNFDVYGTNCGDAPTAANGIHYDWFPDPSDSSQAMIATTSYNNVIKLVNDLGIQGIDLDAEEFWHADKYAEKWNPGSSGEWSTAIAQDILGAGGPSYANLMKYGSGGSTTSGPAIMPKTVEKMAAIMHALEDNPSAKNLMFSTAAPPVGARPITGFVYGDNGSDIYTKGGVWWLGNLKGLWYNLTDKDKAIVDRFDSIGLMTYDLCGDNPTTCAPYGGGPLDLAGQVDAYMKDYTNWLKSSNPAGASLTVDQVGKVAFLPAKYNISSKIQFGFEVNQPAYPRNPSGQLQLTNSLVDNILARQKDSGGVIIWQMYSVQNTSANGTTSKYTMNQSCKTFLANDNRYDCNANFPSAP